MKASLDIYWVFAAWFWSQWMTGFAQFEDLKEEEEKVQTNKKTQSHFYAYLSNHFFF